MTFESATFILLGNDLQVTNPYMTAKRGKVVSVLGVPDGYYVAILKRKKFRPLKLDEIVKPRDLITLMRKSPEVTVRVTFKAGR